MTTKDMKDLQEVEKHRARVFSGSNKLNQSLLLPARDHKPKKCSQPSTELIRCIGLRWSS